jgi:hypothetical protein
MDFQNTTNSLVGCHRCFGRVRERVRPAQQRSLLRQPYLFAEYATLFRPTG